MILKNWERWQRSSCAVPPRTWTAGMALIPWIGVGILLLFEGSCSSRNGPLVQLYPAPLDPATTQVSIAVTATDPSGQSSKPFLFPFNSGPFQPLGVTFPVGTRGPSTYQVNAYDRLSCPLGTGNAVLNLAGDDVFDLQVMMTAAHPGPAAMLSLVAGGLGGVGNADGFGPDARFDYPSGVAVDGKGNLYVADQLNHTIRKVVVATGKVATLAGTAGLSGSTDGTGPAARFQYPFGVALDGAGNLFIADRGNHTIRKLVVATGEVSTLAGTAGLSGTTDGTGPAARFYYPAGVAVDAAGNLFVADASNHTIRKVVVATGAVTTLAGTAGMYGNTDGIGLAARFTGPFGVTVDAAGSLFVADRNNATIRKVVVATGAVSTLAGAAGLSGNANGTGTAANFYQPTGVAVDGAGNLFVADSSNNTIRKVVVATGVVTTLAGTAGLRGSADGTGAAARFNEPFGVAADSMGNLYVADTKNHTIRQLAVVTGAVATLAGTAGMYGSTDGTGSGARFYDLPGVAADGAGNLYVADAGNNTIRQVVVATGKVSTLAGTAGQGGSTDGIGAAARFNYPFGVAVDGAGNLFVADYSNSTIRQVVVATGAVSTLAGTAGLSGSTDGTGPAARFNAPGGVAVDGACNLYVADDGNGTVRQIRLSTGSVTTVVGVAGQLKVKLGLLPAGLNHPTAVATLPNNKLIILNEDAVLLAQ